MTLPENWKTTVAGCSSAFFAFVMFSPHWFHPMLVDIAKFATAGGLIALGLTAKDAGKGSSVITPDANQAIATVQKAVDDGKLKEAPSELPV